MARIAFLTFGIFNQAPDHPAIQGFHARAGKIFETATTIPGYVCLVDSRVSRDAPHSRFFDPKKPIFYAATLSLWSDLDAVFAFAYYGFHAEAFRARSKWFLKPEYPNHAAWWIPDDHTPDWEEAYQRQYMLHQNGPAPQVFNLRKAFDSVGQEYSIDRARVKQIVAECPGLAKMVTLG